MSLETISNKIKSYFKDLEFNEEEHKYSLRGRDVSLTSVSHKIKDFVIPFDTLGNAERVAKREGVTTEEILKRWKDKANNACSLGTKVHLFGELYNGTQKPTNGYEEAIVKFSKIVPPHIDLLINELQMYSEEFGIAGTADLVYYNHNTGKLRIMDWKGLDINTPIPTTKGYKKMGELTYDDIVFDKDGNPTAITGISNTHYKKCYKIVFDNGEEIISDFEHRWLVSTYNSTYSHHKKRGKTVDKYKDKVMTTEEIFNYINLYKSQTYERKNEIINKYQCSLYKLKVLNPKPLNIPEKELPIDPYVLGLWLGDGHSADGKITQANKNVWKEIENRGYTLGEDVSGGGAGIAQTRSVIGIYKHLKELNLIKNKHLPDIYLRSSYNQRLDILRGIMDSDGSYNKVRKRFTMVVGKEWQSKDLAKLVSSLGWKPTIIKAKTTCNGKVFDTWHCDFMTDGTNPFLSRNQDIEIKTTAQSNFRNIISCELVDVVPTKCIEVNSPSHTYLFGYNHIVTHNTNADLFKNFKGQTLLKPFDNILDSPYGKYILQLSFYQLMLEQTGYEVEDRCLIWIKPDGTYTCHKTPDVSKELLNELIKQKNNRKNK